MGQYYYPVLKSEGQKEIMFSRNVGGQYTLAKLTEHSWWENEFMKAIGNKLYKTKGQLAWIGDYAEQQDLKKHNIKKSIKVLLRGEGENIESAEEFTYNNKYLCNHTTKEYLDLSKFYQQSVNKSGWCLCPLSLLTALGNGRGGGDYWGINKSLVGLWAWDVISIEDAKPEDYTEFAIIFMEDF